jgi:hypothetical protein
MKLKFKEENEVFPSFKSPMEDDYVIADELALLVFNIRKEVCGVLNFFLSFKKKT